MHICITRYAGQGKKWPSTIGRNFFKVIIVQNKICSKYLHTDRDIFLATRAPNIIAPIVQIKWPAEPPIKTEKGFWKNVSEFRLFREKIIKFGSFIGLTVETARPTVESWDRSPHSATNVRTKALMKIALQKTDKTRSVLVVHPTFDSSCSSTTDSFDFRSGEVVLSTTSEITEARETKNQIGAIIIRP